MDEKAKRDIRRAAAAIGGIVIATTTSGGILAFSGMAAVVYGVWPRRDNGSWRFFLRASERLPRPKRVTIRWNERGEFVMEDDPISILWVTSLTVVNPTDVAVPL